MTTGLLSDASHSRVNAFDALRLLAALAVLVSHAWAISIAEAAQPRIGDLDLGTVGVRVFFGISGFLIAQSWLTDPHLGRFAAKRALRILPALVLVLAGTTLLLGPALSTLSLSGYLADARTWSYLVLNAVLSHQHELPGLFTNGPTREVNGPLWTLRPEVLAYAGVAVLGLVGALRRRWVAPLVAAILIVVPFDPTNTIPVARELWLFQTFAVGASLYVLRDRVVWHPGLVAASLVAFAVSTGGPQAVLAAVAIPYAAIFTAYRAPAALRRLTAHGDMSYGLYLFAWPIGQAVVMVGGGSVGPWTVIAVSLPVAYVLAMASWRFVERPALAYKTRFARPPATAPPPTAPQVPAGTLPARGGGGGSRRRALVER